MRWTLMLTIVVGTLWSEAASAQTAQDTFQQLREAGRLKTGDSYVVKRHDGTIVTGELQGPSGGTLRLRVRGSVLELAENEVSRIERRDSAEDGFWLGVLAGVGATAAATSAQCSDDKECAVYARIYFGPPLVLGGGAVGYMIDRLLQEVVYVGRPAGAPRLSVRPVVSRHYRGAAVSVAW